MFVPLYASPFRKYLIEGYELAKNNLDKYVYAISEYSHPIQRAMIKSSKGELKYYLPENELVRTQDLEKSYCDCGQFYWASLNTWKTISKIHSNALGTEVPNWLAVDIDTVDDWNRAEIIKKTIQFL